MTSLSVMLVPNQCDYTARLCCGVTGDWFYDVPDCPPPAEPAGQLGSLRDMWHWIMHEIAVDEVADDLYYGTALHQRRRNAYNLIMNEIVETMRYS